MKKTPSRDLILRLEKTLWVTGIAWTLIVAGLFLKDVKEIKETSLALARKEALSHFNKDHATRLWAASHGGIYVPATEKTPPNPYLNHIPERDLLTPSGALLTLMNPAYMLREMMDHYSDLYGIRAHITGLKYFRSETAPDDWETSSLLSFERGKEDVWEVGEIEGNPHLRFMKPLVTEKECLMCHRDQGHEVGDIRGGVSISVPLGPYLTLQRREILKHSLSFGILWGLGLGGIAFAGTKLRGHLVERQMMEDMYTSLVEGSLTGIYIVHEGKIVFGNNRFTEIYGYSKEEVIGMDSLDFVHPEDREIVQDIQRKRMSGGEVPAEYEARGLRKNGDMIWVQRRNRVIDYHGKAAILGNVLDVTPLKKAEAALKLRAVQLEQKNRDLKDFAAVASHDLQEPLRKIRALGELLRSRCWASMDDDGRDYLKRMQGAAKRMTHLIHSLLTYSRVTTKTQSLKPVDLNEVVRTAMSNLEIRLKETQGSISVGELPIVEADEDQMIQLFQNLIGNALKFRSEGKPPSVKIDLEPPSSQEDRGAAFYEITVKDNGIGIDEDKTERIFEPFERLHGRSEYEGAGMGLAICRKIVERHGGAIKAMSSPGNGTTFALRLPAEPTALLLSNETT
jgi:two-component system, chemotaxis family, sensor kinase Cph1